MANSDKLPALPFYVGDWKKDPGIQCLDIIDRGVWLEMLFLMWESPERGYLLTPSRKPFTEVQLSNAIRVPEVLLKQKLKHLLEQNIYSVRENDISIYSRKMVKDEEIRVIRSESGKRGGFATQFAKAKVLAKGVANTEDESENETAIENENKDDIKKLFNKAIEVRTAQFSEAIQSYEGKYDGSMLSGFFKYWKEPDRDKKFMRWEKQATWDLGGRLERWADRAKQQAGPEAGVNKLSQSKRWTEDELFGK